MDEEEAQLLAELRAISAGSASSRFASDDGDDDKNNNEASAPPISMGNESAFSQEEQGSSDGPASAAAQSKSHASSKTEPRNNQQPEMEQSLPPWKRGGQKPKPSMEDVEPHPNPPPSSSLEDRPIGFQKPQNTFQGERGGEANDEDLLAELRAISNQSGAVDRFSGDDNNDDDNEGFGEEENNNNNMQRPSADRRQPPKPDKGSPTKFRKPLRLENQGMDVLVSSHSEDQEIVSVLSEPSVFASSFQKSSLPNTFKGDRGGTAEDEDLLAELRAISAKSASTNRFGNADNEQAPPENSIEPVVEAPKEEAPLPPWKRKGKLANSSESGPDVEITVAAPPPAKKAEAALPPWKQKKTTSQNTETSHDPEIVIAAPPPPNQNRNIGGFQKSTAANTFQGERGGSAEDEELLAELRAISSTSGAADRFGSDENAEHEQSTMPETVSATPPTEAVQEAPKNKSNSLPPSEDSDGVAPTTQPIPEEPQLGGFQKPALPNTFKGERGGAAEDEDLLAELRAISSKSGAVDRFAQDEASGDAEVVPTEENQERETSKPDASLPPWKRKGNHQQQQQQTEDVVVVAAKPPKANESLPPWKKQPQNKSSPQEESQPSSNPTLPPWKQKKANNVVEEAAPATVTEDEPLPQMGGFQKPSLPNTFKGDRGGAAEDEDLLAELRAISAGAGGASRFAENDDNGSALDSPPLQAELAPAQQRVAKPKPSGDKPLPPWKKKAQPVGNESATPVAAPTPDPIAEEEPLPQMGGFQKPSLPNTFKGDRGGAAEDEALLAELRAISAGAGGASRFAENDENGSAHDSPPSQAEQVPVQQRATKPKPSGDKPLPPWKKKASHSEPATPVKEEPVPVSGGFQKPSLPNTFQGDRGGSAEDPALLAELRAISAGAGGPSRFTQEEEASAPPPTAQPSMGGFQKSSLPNTFKGERGGTAEDEDLLAELRAISAGASGANRFANADDTSAEQQETPVAGATRRPVQQPKAAVSRPAPAAPSSGPRVIETKSAAPAGNPDSLVSMDDLPGALTDKTWKVRKAAYELLTNVLSEQVDGKEPTGDIDASSIIEGLDSLVPGMLADSNASALDSALEFSLLYADHCRGATMSGQAEEMVAALVKGSALSASRPSTMKLTTAVVLKLMEVGEDGHASAHAVIDVLLRQGLVSKKPKIVLTASGLIHLAATSFGATCLPIALVNSSAPKMLDHKDKKVRDNGLKVVAEIGRALGSTSHIQVILDSMKKAQVDDLNKLLEAQPQPTPATMSFRSQQGALSSTSPEDALAALEAGTKELEAKRFAARPAVNLIAEVAKTDYSTQITHAKWSEKVAALDKVLECGGEKPYKLMEPSSSVNYGQLISEMKKLLSHTHFAVVGKTMQVLSMLAEGVGEKLYPHLRPIVGNLLALSKDKKLTKFIAPCLDAFFGHILSFDHLLEADALPEGVDEKKQKNALARTCALDFLARSVTRGESAGPRGALTAKSAKRVADFSVSKLDDSDAGVRKAALGVLQSLQTIEDEEISDAVSDIIEGLRTTNTRAHKTLSKTMKAPPSASAKPPTSNQSENQPSPAKHSRTTSSPSKLPSKPSQPVESKVSSTTLPKKPAARVAADAPPRNPDSSPFEADQGSIPLPDAIEYLSQLDIPNFDCEEDEGGILAGLQSTKWLSRQNAIKGLAAFLETEAPSTDIQRLSASMMVTVRENTRGFKETNVKVTQAIMEFFVTVCDYHYNNGYPLMPWAMVDAVALSVDKIADKKVSALGKGLLLNVCLVSRPVDTVKEIAKKVGEAKSPIPHEECQNWFRSFCNDFGAASLGNGIKDVVSWLLTELKNSNVKVKRATNNSIGTLHVQLGPIFKALLLSQCPDSMRDQLEKTVDAHPYDPSSASAEWPKVSIATGNRSRANGANGQQDDEGDGGMSLDIPRMDLFSDISGDCLTKMASKDGKTAWKIRKQAIDEVDAALKKCSALVDCSPASMKQLAELLRALRARLDDSQGNLKPLSARVIGILLSVTDKTAQPKLGKLVYAPLINGAMNDIKKLVRDASLEALRLSTTTSSIEGGGLNNDTLEPFAISLANELSEAKLTAVGLPDLLDFVLTFADNFPDLEHVVVARGQALSEKMAQAMVRCLTSSKVEARSKAETLVTVFIKNGILPLDRVKACTDRMKPAQQRSVGPILAKLARSVPSTEKENVPEEEEHPYKPSGPSKPSTSKPPSRVAAKKPERQAPPTQKAAHESKHITHQHPHSPRSEVSAHPLISDSGPSGLEKSRAALRLLTWPEYPEEPLGSDIYGNLKRAWSPVLPNASAALFFPAGGIRKQDDGTKGCECLSKAILMERAGDGVAIEEHLEFILYWMTIVLCSKDNTVGLQALLSAMSDLFQYLKDIQYELSDPEAMLLIPFVLEKASLAKGRFREVFDDLIVHIKVEEVLPMKRLGSVVAVSMLERASHAKARVAACQDCSMCVEQLGLSGIGKKGVLIGAKALSEETLSENRSACLDLMELVLARMNGDIQRLARICGSSLSDKARRLVEERWQRRKATNPSGAPPKAEDSTARRSRIPTPQKASPTEKAPRSSPGIPAPRATYTGSSVAGIQDELPALVLKHRSSPSPSKETGQRAKPSYSGNGSSTNFLSAFNGSTDSLGFNMSTSSMLADDSNQGRSYTPSLPSISSQHAHSHISAPQSHTERDSFGAAASLRARLLKIREKSKNPPATEMTYSAPPLPPGKQEKLHVPNDESQTPVNTNADESHDEPTQDISPQAQPPRDLGQNTHYLSGLRCINQLLEAETPLPEGSAELDDCIESLKKFHAALSKQQNNIVGMNSDDLALLRQTISDNVDEVIERLARLVRFSLDCEEPSRSAGISVSLLSVCLATLMALFRDRDMAVRVSQGRLTQLIRETGTALLDSRLVVSNHSSSLDEATSTQVVRAINKLAVQAATGGSREASFGALLTLSRQLCFETTALNARLSRVITKLFSRVIKAEEANSQPWEQVDMAMIARSLNGHFDACDEQEESVGSVEQDSIMACRNMATSLVESITKWPVGEHSLRDAMAQAGLDQTSSPLGVVVNECVPTEKPHETLQRSQTPSKGIAVLVSALGSAQTESERSEALRDLRQFTAEHGNQEFEDHLDQLSPAFRNFILEQLAGSHHVEADRSERDENGSVGGTRSDMTERLRQLRTRLNQNEHHSEMSVSPKRLPPSPSMSTGAASAPFPPADASSVSSSMTANRAAQSQSLRERLAAAQANRKNSIVAPEASTSSSRAQALRERLQKVKQQALEK